MSGFWSDGFWAETFWASNFWVVDSTPGSGTPEYIEVSRGIRVWVLKGSERVWAGLALPRTWAVQREERYWVKFDSGVWAAARDLRTFNFSRAVRDWSLYETWTTGN